MLLPNFLTALVLAGHSLARDCKAEIPVSKLASFNITIQGRLIETKVAPAAAACHGEIKNKTTCDDFTENHWLKHQFHSQHPISVAWNQYTSDSCLPSAPICSIKGYPLYVVNASTTEHVKEAVNFARTHNITLNIKNTGHDYRGRSNAPFSLSIWTHWLNSTQDTFVYHEKSFQPKRCEKAVTGAAITVGAGAQVGTIYEFLKSKGQTIIGGTSTTVGIAGYVMGGGHSIISGKYGLAADKVLEFQMVLPSGKVIRANKCRHKRLFWALRGGGGSTFGVVTSITMQTVPMPQLTEIQFLYLAKVWTKSVIGQEEADRALNASTFFLSKLPDLVDREANGYMMSFHKTEMPERLTKMLADKLHVTRPLPITGVVGSIVLVNPNDTGYHYSYLQTVNTEAQTKFSGANLMILGSKDWPNLPDFIDNFETSMPNSGGINMHINSRLASAEMLRNETLIRQVNKKANSDEAGGRLGVLLIGGKGLHDAEPKDGYPLIGGNAVPQGWRRAYASLFVTKKFDPFDTEARSAAVKGLHNALQPMADFDNTMGSYCNEALPSDNYKRDCWGDLKYKRLARTKKRFDPNNLLWCYQCVGSENLERTSDGKLCEKE